MVCTAIRLGFLTLIFKNLYYNIKYKSKYCVVLNVEFCFAQKQ